MSDIRKPRNLSGYFFRYQNPKTDKYENWCIEDIPELARREKIAGRHEDWYLSLIDGLCNTIVSLGDQFGLAREDANDNED